MKTPSPAATWTDALAPASSHALPQARPAPAPDHMKFPGIYRISTPANGKSYIGSSVNIAQRVGQHFSNLRKGTHHNAHLRAAFAKYGEAAMHVEVLEQCPKEDLLVREQHYLDTLRPEYNLSPTAANTLGYRHTPEARAKMTAANKGNQRNLGKKHSEETKALIAAKALGRKQSEQQRARQSAMMRGNSNTLGMPLSESHKRKVGAASLASWEANPARRHVVSTTTKALWANPEWKAAQAARIKAGKAKARDGHSQV